MLRLLFSPGLLVALLIAPGLASAADAATPFSPGAITDPVACAAEPSQRYALYVPSNYSPDRAWPVVFCFDPGARGRIAVDRLQAGAERYGYLVAASLNSRNGSWEANGTAAMAMIRDVDARFRLDRRRLYTAGLSGGARVATAIALEGTATGVIAGGAGFPALPGGMPLKIRCAFFGTVGVEDFNYAELRRVDDELQQRDATHRIVEFSGGHEWAPAEVLTEALAWFELQAMRAGTRTRDAGFIETLFQERVSALPPLDGVERWRALQSLVADFHGLADTAGFERATTALGASATVKAGLKSERALAAREKELLDDLEHSASGGARRQKSAAVKINQLADAPEDSPERRMARRARSGFVAMTRERTADLLEHGDYHVAADMLVMADRLRPHQPRILYDLARAQAFTSAREQAMQSLEQAITAGFSDVASVAEESAFRELRDDPRFRRALEKINAPAALALPTMRISAALASVALQPFFQPNAGTGELTIAFLRVDHVAPNSAAARAGLTRGMEIIAIQGLRVRGLAEDELHRLLDLPVRNDITLRLRETPDTKEKELRISARLTSTPETPAPSPRHFRPPRHIEPIAPEIPDTLPPTLD